MINECKEQHYFFTIKILPHEFLRRFSFIKLLPKLWETLQEQFLWAAAGKSESCLVITKKSALRHYGQQGTLKKRMYPTL